MGQVKIKGRRLVRRNSKKREPPRAIGQDIQQAVPPKKPKKVTIAKASTRKIATRSSSKAPEGGEGGAETGKGRSEEEQAGGEDIGRELWEVAKGGTEKEAQGSGTDDPVDIRRDSPRTSRAEHGKHDLQGAMLDMIRWRKGRRRKARQVKPSYSIRYALGWEEQSSKDIPPTQSTPSPTTPGSPISTYPPSSTIPPPSPLHVHIRLSEKQLCPCRSQASRFQPRARATFRGAPLPLTIFNEAWQDKVILHTAEKRVKSDTGDTDRYTGYPYPSKYLQTYQEWSINHQGFLAAVRKIPTHANLAAWLVAHKQNSNMIIWREGYMTALRYDIHVRNNALTHRVALPNRTLSVANFSVLRKEILLKVHAKAIRFGETDFPDNPYAAGACRFGWDPTTGQPPAKKDDPSTKTPLHLQHHTAKGNSKPGPDTPKGPSGTNQPQRQGARVQPLRCAKKSGLLAQRSGLSLHPQAK
ncbi:hypothetical protein PTTG_28669 [Puccinia triticina 1-1 BBBD Race 1]|uniref:Uncharacterized protein n=1 Tax=Puccinia triticina (isolate 1-1 / race 1 (BBBD)) TaxID=630390 RepID=A0A180GC57_PUCT1|nr:hypothetical protein PTTG_28669 [Puccinia triticina 1-1 BBBD Race 1]